MQPTWQTPDGSIRLFLGDCLRVMPELEPGIDAVIADLPYGTTACKWDTVIPFEPLWENYKRLVKRNAAIVLTASQPFTSALVMSNPKWFKYELVYEKTRATGFLNAPYQPLRAHENVLVFSDAASTFSPLGNMQFHPQMESGKPWSDRRTERGETRFTFHTSPKKRTPQIDRTARHPRSVIRFSFEQGAHPTQKPVALMEYLIRTYTNEGETVLDNTMGSGTTGIACIRTARKFVGIEKDPGIFATAVKRFEAELAKQPLLEGVA